MMRRPSITWKMPPHTIADGSSPLMERPSRRMSPVTMAPFSQCRSPEIDFNVVDLPAPLGPSSSTILPLGTDRLTPRSTSTTSS